MSTDAPAISEMSRDELADEVEHLRERLDILEGVIQVPDDKEPEDIAFEDVRIAGVPIARLIGKAEQNATRANNRIDELVDGDTSSAELSENVREQMLPIHEMWTDVRNGNVERLPNSSARRGARLFGAMIQKASGQTSVGVDATYGVYKITSSSARQILEDADDMTESGKSMTVKRAMKAVQKFSKVKDCDCSSLKSCEHGLVQWHSGSPNTLVSQKDQFNTAMANVEAAIEGTIDTKDEKETDGSDASTEDKVVSGAEERLSALDQAEVSTE